MKILSVALLVMASMAFVLSGCSDKSGPIVAPTDQAMSSGSTAGPSKTDCQLHSAAGTAYWKTLPFTGETQEKNVFSAIRLPNGKIAGEIWERDAVPQVVFDGKATDLKVSGNKAKMCYKITNGTWALGVPPQDIKGFFACIVVIDQGHGSSPSQRDEVSLTLVTDGSDIAPTTISEVVAMTPDQYIAWVSSTFGITNSDFFPRIDRGLVEVR